MLKAAQRFGGSLASKTQRSLNQPRSIAPHASQHSIVVADVVVSRKFPGCVALVSTKPEQVHVRLL